MNLTGLPSMETTFEIDIKGNDTGKQWRGTFTYRRLNYKLKLEAAKYAAILNGDLKTLQQDIKFTNDVLAILKYGLVDYPKWWEECNYGLEVYDDNIIAELYKKCDEFEQEFRKQIQEGLEEANK